MEAPSKRFQNQLLKPLRVLAGLTQISIVIPCFNEADVLPLLRERLVGALDALEVAWEVVAVDDGSFDETFALLSQIHEEDERFKVVRLSRNFGHQAALLAGLSFSSGQAVAIMDADLQDPPEVLGDYLEHWRNGYDVVYAIRRKRKEGLLKRLAYALYYRLLKRVSDVEIPLDAGDFCLMDRRVVNVLLGLPERNVFLRGLRAWSGFRQIGVRYERQKRAAGAPKYSFQKLVHLALDGIFSFSTMPLRFATWLGLAIVIPSFLGAGFTVFWRLSGLTIMGNTGETIPGWASSTFILLFLGGVQLFVLGIMGEYLARIYTEVKARPRWIARTTLGVQHTADDEAGVNPRREQGAPGIERPKR